MLSFWMSWDPKSGELLATLQHGAPVSTIAYSPNGAQLATGSYDQTIKLWDAKTGTRTHVGTTRRCGSSRMRRDSATSFHSSWV